MSNDGESGRGSAGAALRRPTKGILAVLAVGVGLLLASVIVFTAQKTGILGRPHGPDILIFGTLATFIAGSSVFGLLARRGKPPSSRRRWRDLKPSDPLYGAWRGVRERRRFFWCVLSLGLLVRAIVVWAGFKIESEVLDLASMVPPTRAAHWPSLPVDSAMRYLAYVEGTIALAWAATLASAVYGLSTWPCPQCGHPFGRHRRRWYLVVAIAFAFAASIPLFLEVRREFLTLGWTGAVLHRHRDNYARRSGDPDWRKKIQGYCVHCGLAAWSPSLPGNLHAASSVSA
jgi:hypothetical protein